MEDVRIIAPAMHSQQARRIAADELQQGLRRDLVKAHDDFREILARPDIDAVFIGAHDNWHTPMAIAAMKAGKDVYCQKPLALDLLTDRCARRSGNQAGVPVRHPVPVSDPQIPANGPPR